MTFLSCYLLRLFPVGLSQTGSYFLKKQTFMRSDETQIYLKAFSRHRFPPLHHLFCQEVLVYFCFLFSADCLIRLDSLLRSSWRLTVPDELDFITPT